MTRYRATMFGRDATPWRGSIEEAQADAIARGWASRDEHVPKRLYWSVGARIEWTDWWEGSGGVTKTLLPNGPR